MAEELEGDLQETVVWGADMRRSLFRDVDLTGSRITHAFLVDVEVDAHVDRFVVNGVDVTAYVNEHDPWHPLRTMIVAADPDAMRVAWARYEEAWAEIEARARTRPDADLHRRVDDEWSFVETARHLVMAIDKWFTAPIAGGAFHPIGLPNTGSRDFGWPGIDLDATPGTDEALAVWGDRRAAVAAYVATVSGVDLERQVDILENGPHTVRQCLQTVFEEGFWHLRYADRDLTALDTQGV